MWDDLSLLLLRALLGALFVRHGSQKLFGSFGGGGIEGTAGMFSKSRLRSATTMAMLVGLCEFCGGIGLVLGFLTPLAAVAITAVMLGAIALVHWPRVWVTDGGFEYPLVNLVVAALFGIGGPGGWSFDAALGTGDVLPNPWTYFLAAVVASVAVGWIAANRLPATVPAERSQRPAA